MSRNFRAVLWFVVLAQTVMTIGFVFHVPAITSLWPVAVTPLSYTFIGSILAAAAVSTAWVLWTREDAALAGVALDYITIFVPTAILLVQLADGNTYQLAFAAACAVTVGFGLYMFRVTWLAPVKDPRPMPRLVYASFAVFAITLVIVGGLLVTRTPNILPWSVTPEFGAIVGWMFLGAATYFVYALVRPGWYNAAGQLAGFLIYDLVLIVPLGQRLINNTAPELRTNLLIYLTVIVYSGVLAAYYLFVNPATRLFRQRRLAAA